MKQIEDSAESIILLHGVAFFVALFVALRSMYLLFLWKLDLYFIKKL